MDNTIETAEGFILSKLNPKRTGRLDIIEIEHAAELMVEYVKEFLKSTETK